MLKRLPLWVYLTFTSEWLILKPDLFFTSFSSLFIILIIPYFNCKKWFQVIVVAGRLMNLSWKLNQKNSMDDLRSSHARKSWERFKTCGFVSLDKLRCLSWHSSIWDAWTLKHISCEFVHAWLGIVQILNN